MYKMKGIIYKISSPSTDKIYIGSTTNTLANRFKSHKSNSNKTRSTEIMILGDAVIECLEEIEFDDETTLRRLEGEYIKLNLEKCVNKNIAGRTDTEYSAEYKPMYYLKNKEVIDKKNKEYYELHKQETLDYQRSYYAENKKAVADRAKVYYEANAETIKQYNRDLWHKN